MVHEAPYYIITSENHGCRYIYSDTWGSRKGRLYRKSFLREYCFLFRLPYNISRFESAQVFIITGVKLSVGGKRLSLNGKRNLSGSGILTCSRNFNRYPSNYKNNLKAGATASAIVRGKGNYSGTVICDNLFTVKDVTLDGIRKITCSVFSYPFFFLREYCFLFRLPYNISRFEPISEWRFQNRRLTQGMRLPWMTRIWLRYYIIRRFVNH